MPQKDMASVDACYTDSVEPAATSRVSNLHLLGLAAIFHQGMPLAKFSHRQSRQVSAGVQAVYSCRCVWFAGFRLEQSVEGKHLVYERVFGLVSRHAGKFSFLNLF